MLFVLGIGSVVALTSAVVTILCDQFKGLVFWKVALTTSVIGFCVGLIYMTPVSLNIESSLRRISSKMRVYVFSSQVNGS